MPTLIFLTSLLFYLLLTADFGSSPLVILPTLIFLTSLLFCLLLTVDFGSSPFVILPTLFLDLLLTSLLIFKTLFLVIKARKIVPHILRRCARLSQCLRMRCSNMRCGVFLTLFEPISKHRSSLTLLCNLLHPKVPSGQSGRKHSLATNAPQSGPRSDSLPKALQRALSHA